MWSERVIANFTLPYGVIARIGKCFLILMNENKDTLCYKKFSATDFIYDKPAWQYHEMIPDPSVNKVRGNKSGGIVSFRCFFRQVEDSDGPNYDMNNHMPVKKLPKRPKA